MDLSIYEKKAGSYRADVENLTTTFNRIGTVRLFLFIGLALLIYFYLTRQTGFLLVLLVVCFASLIAMIRWHQNISRKKEMCEGLWRINQDELNFLAGTEVPFETGEEFIDHQHPYTYDLDVFGTHSLFQHLNRTGTWGGKSKLADALIKRSDADSIPNVQQAVRELAPMIDWRQQLLATARVNRDSKAVHDYLIRWSARTGSIKTWVRWLSYLVPVALFISIIVLISTGEVVLLNLVSFLFIGNLIILSTQYKNMKSELLDSDQVDKIVKQYASLIKVIDQPEFKNTRLNKLQKDLIDQDVQAKDAVEKLSQHLALLDSVHNDVVMLIYNGLGCYHIHILGRLYNWRKEHGPYIETWLNAISEIEMLNSLANFSCNNPSYAFPDISPETVITFKDLGHPLIRHDERVDNDISFDPYRFIILTGSNMSGKSTFLRCLGVNMILGGCGAPVCATSAVIKPMQVLVSMRVADSLSDHESYFFAEVKRLKFIMDQLEKGDALILLDEILRGTNSDDKRGGTLAVIKRLVEKRAIGMIATHDLEVCNIVTSYPHYLTNKCFEVEIIEDELSFDFQLRNGICQNQSASFLMKKTGVI